MEYVPTKKEKWLYILISLGSNRKILLLSKNFLQAKYKYQLVVRLKIINCYYEITLLFIFLS